MWFVFRLKVPCFRCSIIRIFYIILRPDSLAFLASSAWRVAPFEGLCNSRCSCNTRCSPESSAIAGPCPVLSNFATTYRPCSSSEILTSRNSRRDGRLCARCRRCRRPVCCHRRPSFLPSSLSDFLACSSELSRPSNAAFRDRERRNCPSCCIDFCCCWICHGPVWWSPPNVCSRLRYWRSWSLVESQKGSVGRQVQVKGNHQRYLTSKTNK
jgi:hypothetical protein